MSVFSYKMEEVMSALFFDIDGTILSEITHEIPESALVALRKAQENGHKTFINTGRTICSVPPMIKRIPFDGFFMWMWNTFGI